MLRRFLNMLPYLGLILGLAIIGYYPVSEAVDAYKRAKVAESLDVEVAETDTSELEEIFAQAHAYNAYLAGETDENYTEDEVWDYEDQLALPQGHNIAFGYVIIPTISLTIPIYHGTSEGVLAAGAGHLEGTSLPVGGSSTHAVITGHTGMSTSKAFDDISSLEVGDVIGVKVLGELICYEVTSTEVVLPEDVWDCVEIESGEDLLTLMTCTPYGINTHRLLVHATRCEVPDDFNGEVTSVAESVASSWQRLVPFAAAFAVVGGTVVALFIHKRRARREDMEHMVKTDSVGGKEKR